MQDSGLLQAYMEHERALLRFLGRRLGSASLAADILHDLYLRLRRGEDAASVRDRRAYLFSMAANLATDHLRVERRRDEIRAAAGEAVWYRADEITPERSAMARAELAYLEAEVANLDVRCRQVFYLSRYEGKAQGEIAAALGVGVTTVYKDLKTVMGVLVAARRRFRGQGPDADG